MTASFCLNGAEFLTDDVTPIIFKDDKPFIWALSDRIKLWEDTLSQLNQDKEGLHRIDPTTDKFYYPIESGRSDMFKLDHIMILEISEKPDIVFEEVSGALRFATLRNEVYRWEYLHGMPESEADYFKQLVSISKVVNIARVSRPGKVNIVRLMAAINKYLSKQME